MKCNFNWLARSNISLKKAPQHVTYHLFVISGHRSVTVTRRMGTDENVTAYFKGLRSTESKFGAVGEPWQKTESIVTWSHWCTQSTCKGDPRSRKGNVRGYCFDCHSRSGDDRKPNRTTVPASRATVASNWHYKQCHQCRRQVHFEFGLLLYSWEFII